MGEPINEISFDIDFLDRSVQRIDFKPVQNDSQTYKFVMTPLKDGVAYTLEGGWTYTISVRRPNYTSVIDTATVDETDIVYTLGSSFLEQYGVHKCTVEIFTGAKRLSSNTFMWEALQEHGGDKAITNTNEYPVYSRVIDLVDENGIITPNGYESSDGTTAITQDVEILDGDGVSTHTLTFKDGLLTAYSKV